MPVLTAGQAFYAAIITSADLLVQKYGRQFTLTHLTANAPADPTKPWLQSDPTPTTVTLFGAFTKYDRKLIDNTTIKATDKKLIFLDPLGKITWGDISNSDVVQELPPPNGTGQRYIVMDVDIVAPGPVNAVYELQVRLG